MIICYLPPFTKRRKTQFIAPLSCTSSIVSSSPSLFLSVGNCRTMDLLLHTGNLPPTPVHCPKRIKKVSIKPVLVFNLSGAVSQFWLGSKKLKQQVQGKGKKMKVHDFLKLAWTSKIQAINLEHINVKKKHPLDMKQGETKTTQTNPKFPCKLQILQFTVGVFSQPTLNCGYWRVSLWDNLLGVWGFKLTN